MKRILLATLIALPLPLAAQQDDKGWLTTWLEENLSGEGHQVVIEGFKGALSSRASIERLTIADAQGVWLTLSDVALDWNRASLLQGAVAVNQLTAAEIDLQRLPAAGTGAALPSPEAQPFRLPELPVSIQIGEIAAARVVLGAAVLGQPIEAQVSASLDLAGGDGDVMLRMERLDTGPQGLVTLDAAYSNASETLRLDLVATEGAGGIVASLSGLPGTPALELTAKGQGPISDFSADLGLVSDGLPRLAGNVTVTAGAEGSTGFAVDIGGNLAPLFLPQYAAFFGDSVTVKAGGARANDGALRLDRVQIATDALDISGALALAADGLPERLALDIRLGDGQQPVLLPLSGPETRVDGASLTLGFDKAQGDGWQIKGDLLGLDQAGVQGVGGLRLGRVTLDGAGSIGRRDGVAQVDGKVTWSAAGIAPADPALAQMLGAALQGEAAFAWNDQTDSLSLPRLTVSGDGLAASGTAQIEGLSSGFNLSGEMQADLADLSRASGLAGRPLGGAAQLRVSGSGAVLSGQFDLTGTVEGKGLRLGQAEADRLLAGASTLTFSARRDASGTALRELSVTAGALTAKASGTLTSSGSTIQGEARLGNLALLVPEFPGALTMAGSLRHGPQGAEIDIAAKGPGGIDLTAKGRLSADFSRAEGLALRGVAQAGLANALLAPRRVAGPLRFDLTMTGPLTPASLAGTVSLASGRFAAADLPFSLEGAAAAVRLSGGRATLEATTGISTGGTVAVNGTFGLAAPFNGNLNATIRGAVIRDPRLYEARLSGDLTVDGPLTGGATIGGQITVQEAELQVPSTGFSAAAALDPLTHVGEPADVRATRARAGLQGDTQASAASGGGGGKAWPLNLQIDAPNRLFLRGRGLDTELGGRFRLGGTTANIIPSGGLKLIRGRLDILGKRLNVASAGLTLEGGLMPDLDILASTTSDGITASVHIEGPADRPDVSFESQPELPQEEVLAHLLFGRDLTQLSAFQAAQLASAVASLAGKGGEGIVAKLRKGFGLDNLDVQTSEEGGTSVTAGKYLSKNLYTEVIVGEEGSSEINLNLDLSDSITLRGSTNTTGETGLGIFFEQDY